jgi:hypothetical protein
VEYSTLTDVALTLFSSSFLRVVIKYRGCNKVLIFQGDITVGRFAVENVHNREADSGKVFEKEKEWVASQSHFSIGT